MDVNLRNYRSILLLLVSLGFFYQLSLPGPVESVDSSELQIALGKLNVLGSVLYIAAHPDDENTSALAYFSKGKMYRTAYLSLTRGDGGQNLIGPEKGAEIGIIRTQELLSARRIDKAEQYFTRAIDFGYSKSSEETLEIWGKEEVLEDIVWVIRTYRPDVIISRFPLEGSSGHGHHTASGPLITEAFRAAADPNRFPGQLKLVQPWQAKRLFWNSWRPDPQERERLPRIDTGGFNSLLGKSYTEISALSRSQHKSQGFGMTGRRGTQWDYYQQAGGDSVSEDPFEGIDTTWSRIPGGRTVGDILGKVIAAFDPLHPSRSVSGLLEALAVLDRLETSPWIVIKRKELLHVIRACAGLWLEAIADDFSASPGDEIRVKSTLVNRSGLKFKIDDLTFPGLSSEMPLDAPLEDNLPKSFDHTLRIPKDFPISQPYWLEKPPTAGLFTTEDQRLIGKSDNPPSIQMRVTLELQGNVLEYDVPLLFRWTDRVDGELYRPFEVRPPVTLEIAGKVGLFSNGEPKAIQVVLKSHTENASGIVRLKGPGEWKISPESVPFAVAGKYQETQITFMVSPPNESGETFLTAEAEVAGIHCHRSLVEISYPHIKRQVYFPESRIKLVKLDIQVKGSKLGYIMGAGDEVADGLRSLGYDVVLLDDSQLDDMDFSQFDAVITGVRAYNTRSRLRIVQPKLLEYVQNGGTLIVQYNVSRGLVTDEIGPYPLTFGSERVSMETAAVTFPNPKHSLLNFPNKITAKDFDGWVQERGLYFATRWDPRYEPILAAHDTGEPSREGGLLYTKYGKGVFIYTGYSWFRQIPEGVPGAFRLFVNMISAGKSDD